MGCWQGCGALPASGRCAHMLCCALLLVFAFVCGAQATALHVHVLSAPCRECARVCNVMFVVRILIISVFETHPLS